MPRVLVEEVQNRNAFTPTASAVDTIVTMQDRSDRATAY
jgi:hypothetical protein